MLAKLTILLMLLVPASALSVGMTGGTSAGIGLVTTFVVAGQSNAYGSGGTEAVPGVRFVPNPNKHPQGEVLKYTATSFVQMTDTVLWPANAYEATPWPWFVKKWIETVQEPVRLIFQPIGGSCLCADDGVGDEPQWDPDGVSPIGDRYDAMVTAATSTFKPGPSLRAVLWDHGECEQSAATTPTGTKLDDYQAALEDLADNIWADLHVPMIISPLSLYTGSTCALVQARQDIHDGQDAAAAAHVHILDTVVDKDDLDFDTDSDCSHVYDVKTLGERWFDAIAAEGLAY